MRKGLFAKSMLALAALPAFVATPAAAQSSVFGNTPTTVPQLVINGDIFVNAIARGRYRDTDGRTYTGGYQAGTNAAGRTFHSYFVFDLPDQLEDIFSASLVLNTGGVTGPPVSINFFAYTGSITTLTSATWSTAAYADLADGSVYGSRSYTSADVNVWHNVALNGTALGSMNRADGGLFAMGAAQGPTTVTPEPISMILMGTGLAGVGAVRRRRAKKEEGLA